MMDYSQIAKILGENGSFLLTTHVNPDADAIGSEVAVYLILKKLGKKVHIINYSDLPQNLAFLDKDHIIEKYDSMVHDSIIGDVDVIIALDFNNPSRTISMEKLLTNFPKVKICIDHHQNPKSFADHYFIDVTAVATGQIIYELIRETAVAALDRDIADCLYAAIMTDTGSFRFERTGFEVHQIAAELLRCGVNPTKIYDMIYDRNKFEKIKLLGDCLSKMTLIYEGKIAYIVITQKELNDYGLDESDIDGFVNYCLSVDGVKIGILFFEMNDGLKVSFRSKGTIPVNSLAEKFGGGGHINASGARISGNHFYDCIASVIDAAENFV